MAINVTVADADDTAPTNPSTNRSLQDYTVRAPTPRKAVLPERDSYTPASPEQPWTMIIDGLTISGPRYNSFIRAGRRLQPATKAGWPASITLGANVDKWIYVKYNIETCRFDSGLLASTTFPGNTTTERAYVIGRAVTDGTEITGWHQFAHDNIYDEFQNSFWAKIESESPDGEYVMERLADDASTSYSPAQTVTVARDIMNAVGLPVGGKYRIWPVTLADGSVEYRFCGMHVTGLFAVDVATDGGTAGDGTTQCSFTYEVQSLSGVVLLTGATPSWARPSVGALIAATKGMCYIASDETVVLYQVDEQPDPEVCVE